MYDPETVTSDEVANYRGLIEHEAFKLSKLNRDLAEFDDLVQVGMIRVWTLLRRGTPPTTKRIHFAMVDELRRRGTPRAAQVAIPDDLDLEFLALDGAGL